MKTTPWSALTLHKPLREVFWFYGVIPSHILWGMTLLAYFNGATLGTNILMFGVVLIYTAWIIAQIWVSSAMQEATIYSDIARYLTAAWGLNSLLLVIFLLLQRLQ